MSKTISVTENFQIVHDSNQYVVQAWQTVDPRNSPKFDPDKHNDKEIRQVWKDNGYFGLNVLGLQAAIKSIIIQEAGLGENEKLSLKEYLKSIKDISNMVDDAVEGLF